MFRRQNAGKPLNNKQLRIIYQSDEFSDAIYSLARHPFMEKLLTKTQRKNGTDRDLIVQTLMLICTNREHDFTSFRTKNIDAFVKTYGDESLSKMDVLKEALDKLDETFEDIKIPITSIPMVLYSSYRVKKVRKSFAKFVEAVINFLDNYDNNEEYKKYVQSGTGSSENVKGRLEYWQDLVKGL